MDDVGRLCRGVAVLIAVSLIMGFFTACGNAVLHISDSKLEKGGDSSKDKRIRKLQEKPEIIIQTNLAVRTAVIMLTAVFGQALFLQPLKRLIYARAGEAAAPVFIIAAVIAATLAAVIISALGVNVPKRLCVCGKIGVGFIYSVFTVYSFFLTVFRPVQIVFFYLSKAVLRICGVRDEQPEQITEEEILQMLDAANENGGIEDDQAEMISNIFEFSDLEVHEVMTHRTDIAAVEYNSPVSEAVKLSVETGFSRIPVYRETVDDICGVIYIKDLLPLILQPESCAGKAHEYLHKVKFVPETGGCGDLFSYFTENKKQIAVVLDEYGGTAGIVTMEDLLECIVGNIRDEYDENEAEEIEEITPNTFDILGGANPDDVMERLGHTLGDDHDYDTIGGFVTALLGYIPADGETPTVRWRDITFGIISAKDNRIEKLRAIKDHKKAVVFDED